MLQAENGKIVGAEGLLWYFNGRRWQTYEESRLFRLVLAFDKEPLDRGCLWASDQFINGTLNCLSYIVDEQDFFINHEVGICCQSGFITLDGKLLEHAPEQRHRFVLPGSWYPGVKPEGPLLERMLEGRFEDDDEAAIKIGCLRQLAGCTILGYGTQLANPKAFTFWGPSALNGKSQLFELYKALVPPKASCSLSLAGLSNPYFTPHLAGKLPTALQKPVT